MDEENDSVLGFAFRCSTVGRCISKTVALSVEAISIVLGIDS